MLWSLNSDLVADSPKRPSLRSCLLGISGLAPQQGSQKLAEHFPILPKPSQVTVWQKLPVQKRMEIIPAMLLYLETKGEEAHGLFERLVLQSIEELDSLASAEKDELSTAVLLRTISQLLEFGSHPQFQNKPDLRDSVELGIYDLLRLSSDRFDQEELIALAAAIERVLEKVQEDLTKASNSRVKRHQSLEASLYLFLAELRQENLVRPLLVEQLMPTFISRYQQIQRAPRKKSHLELKKRLARLIFEWPLPFHDHASRQFFNEVNALFARNDSSVRRMAATNLTRWVTIQAVSFEDLLYVATFFPDVRAGWLREDSPEAEEKAYADLQSRIEAIISARRLHLLENLEKEHLQDSNHRLRTDLFALALLPDQIGFESGLKEKLEEIIEHFPDNSLVTDLIRRTHSGVHRNPPVRMSRDRHDESTELEASLHFFREQLDALESRLDLARLNGLLQDLKFYGFDDVERKPLEALLKAEAPSPKEARLYLEVLQDFFYFRARLDDPLLADIEVEEASSDGSEDSVWDPEESEEVEESEREVRPGSLYEYTLPSLVDLDYIESLMNNPEPRPTERILAKAYLKYLEILWNGSKASSLERQDWHKLNRRLTLAIEEQG